MYCHTIEILKNNGVIVENGLTNNEVKEIEELYGIIFPKSLRAFLMTGVPISNGFFNWRDTSLKNISHIKLIMNYPIKYPEQNIVEIEWSDRWGDEPPNKTAVITEIKKRLLTAPILIPVFCHRFMPMMDIESPPILSIHGTDVIYYGKSLIEYFNIEFNNKGQSEIDFKGIKYIPFWADIM